MKEKINLSASITRGFMYLWILIVVINMGMENLFFSPFVSFVVLLSIAVFNAIFELVLKRPLNFWDQKKPRLITNSILISLILFFFIFFTPDPRIWIIFIIPLFDLVKSIAE